MLGVPARRPDDAVYQPATGQWQRPVQRLNAEGQPITQLRVCCEECWEIMPNYVEAPSGYVSPDSNVKLRTTMTDGHASVEAIEKCVCYDCFLIVYARVTPASLGQHAPFEHRIRE